MLLAGTGVTGEEILYHQGTLIARVQKAGEKSIADARDLQTELFRVLRDEPDDEQGRRKIARVVDESESLAKQRRPKRPRRRCAPKFALNRRE